MTITAPKSPTLSPYALTSLELPTGAIPGLPPLPSVDPLLFADTDTRALLGAGPSALPETFGAPRAPLPLQALEDPRGAMLRRRIELPLERYDTPAELDQNLRSTFVGLGDVPAMNREVGWMMALSQQLLLMSMMGVPKEALTTELGGAGAPGATELADKIQALRDAIASGDVDAMRRAATGANHAMLNFMAGGDSAKAKQLGAFLRQQYGLSADPAHYSGQGAFGGAIQEATRGRGDVLAPPPGAFKAGNPSEVGAKMLDAARSQVGVREATGNNDGIPSQRYANGRREPWCADFVSWSMRQASPTAAAKYGSAGVSDMESKMQRDHKWFARGAAAPKPGDVIFFANRGDSDHGHGRHVGIVEKVENGRVYTVEGNSSNAVHRRSYPLDAGRIAGYGRV